VGELWFGLALVVCTGRCATGNGCVRPARTQVEVRVTRAGKTLPIAQVPNPQAGDRIWVHPNLPDEQSVRYVLVAAFLRGATNPPPESWFTKAQTWTKQVREEGIVLTLPKDAQQLLLFLAPETGGDFGTLAVGCSGKTWGLYQSITGPELGEPGSLAPRRISDRHPGNF
jgi:hypothetical protein